MTEYTILPVRPGLRRLDAPAWEHERIRNDGKTLSDGSRIEDLEKENTESNGMTDQDNTLKKLPTNPTDRMRAAGRQAIGEFFDVGSFEALAAEAYKAMVREYLEGQGSSSGRSA